MLCFHAAGRSARIGAAVLSVAALAACDDDPVTPAAPIEVDVTFAAEVNGAAFGCTQSYANVGASNTTISPKDFRFYVHDVTLLAADGSEAELDLDQDGTWQYENVALLDFENATGTCTGTAPTNSTVTGTVPDDTYTGIRFTLGVPFELNHIDQTTAPAPLDIAGMFWSWNAGYKFVRADHESAALPGGWNVHLGSTGCTPGGGRTVIPTDCANQHRVEVTFAGFDVESDVIVADLGTLLGDSDVTVNATDTRVGCMSFPGDADCPAVMNNFGLDYEGSVSGGQSFFSVR